MKLIRDKKWIEMENEERKKILVGDTKTIFSFPTMSGEFLLPHRHSNPSFYQGK